MGGAVVVMAVAWAFQRRMAHPLFADAFSLPDKRELDARLLGGAALFGIGWGLAGICPGPAVASLALKPVGIAPFVVAMIAGMWIHRQFLDRSKG
jgi:uncharacterized membrane protein YedE/YeeE